MNKQLRITWFYDNILTNNNTAICKKDYNRMNEQKYLINNEKLMKEWDWEENNKTILYHTIKQLVQVLECIGYVVNVITSGKLL